MDMCIFKALILGLSPSSAQTPAPYTHAANPALPPPPRTPPTPSFRTHAPREPPSLLQTMVSTARAAAVVMAVAVVSAARLAHAAVLPGEPDVISVLVPSTARGRESLPPALLLPVTPCSFGTPPLGFGVLRLDASFDFSCAK